MRGPAAISRVRMTKQRMLCTNHSNVLNSECCNAGPRLNRTEQDCLTHSGYPATRLLLQLLKGPRTSASGRQIACKAKLAIGNQLIALANRGADDHANRQYASAGPLDATV
jgi:hypothetical protein